MVAGLRARLKGLLKGLVAGGCALPAAAPWPPAAAQEPALAAPYVIADGARIEHALTEGLSGALPPDPARGAAVWVRAGCGECHEASEADQPPAADLAGLASRMEAGALRLWIVAPEAVAPGTPMPGYYLPGQRRAPDDPAYGGPTLGAQEIEDLIAWLMSR